MQHNVIASANDTYVFTVNDSPRNQYVQKANDTIPSANTTNR